MTIHRARIDDWMRIAVSTGRVVVPHADAIMWALALVAMPSAEPSSAGAAPTLEQRTRQRAQVRKLGEGAFATVEECVLRGSHVAVKRLKPELFADVMEVNDFLLEGVLIAQVHHPCALNLTRTVTIQELFLILIRASPLEPTSPQSATGQ